MSVVNYTPEKGAKSDLGLKVGILMIIFSFFSYFYLSIEMAAVSLLFSINLISAGIITYNSENWEYVTYMMSFVTISFLALRGLIGLMMSLGMFLSLMGLLNILWVACSIVLSMVLFKKTIFKMWLYNELGL